MTSHSGMSTETQIGGATHEDPERERAEQAEREPARRPMPSAVSKPRIRRTADGCSTLVEKRDAEGKGGSD